MGELGVLGAFVQGYGCAGASSVAYGLLARLAATGRTLFFSYSVLFYLMSVDATTHSRFSE